MAQTPGFYRRKDILQSGRLPVSSSTLNRWIQEGKFPAPIRISERIAVWPVEVAERALEELKTSAEGRRQ